MPGERLPGLLFEAVGQGVAESGFRTQSHESVRPWLAGWPVLWWFRLTAELLGRLAPHSTSPQGGEW